MERLRDYIVMSECYDGLILRYEYPNSDEFVLMDPVPRDYRKRLIAARRLDNLEDPFIFNDLPIGSRFHYYDFFDELYKVNKDFWQYVMYAKRGDIIKQNSSFIITHIRSKDSDHARILQDLFNEVFSKIEEPISPLLRVGNFLAFNDAKTMMLYRLGVTEIDFEIIDMNAFFDQIESDLDSLFSNIKLIHIPGIFTSDHIITQVR